MSFNLYRGLSYLADINIVCAFSYVGAPFIGQKYGKKSGNQKDIQNRDRMLSDSGSFAVALQLLIIRYRRLAEQVCLSQ